ncbi:MAG: hypothetical protein ACI31G_04780 [Bacilli bacterium]
MTLKKIFKFYKEKELGLYLSLIGLFFLAVVNTISTFKSFSFLSLNYAIMYYLFAIARTIFRLNKNSKYIYLYGILSFVLITLPLVLSMVLTVLEKDKPVYLFDWIIYAYALYATIKMVTSIKNATRKHKSQYDTVITLFGLLSALYTIQSLQFSLISIFGEGEKLLLLQLFYQGFVVIYIFFSIIYLIVISIKSAKVKKAIKNNRELIE